MSEKRETFEKIASMKKRKRSDDLAAALFQFEDKNQTVLCVECFGSLETQQFMGFFQGEFKEPEPKNTTSLVRKQLKMAGNV